jgi:hypothetical protein
MLAAAKQDTLIHATTNAVNKWFYAVALAI